MNTKTILLIIAVLLLIGVLLFFWRIYAKTEKELVLAEQNTTQAQEALVLAEEATEAKRQEMAQAQVESNESLDKTEKVILKLMEEKAASQQTISGLSTDNEKLKEHIKGLSNPDVELKPQPIGEVILAGVNLYPERNLQDAEIQGNAAGLELVQLMVLELQDRRPLDKNNKQIITEYQDQTARLEAVIKEHEKRALAMGRSYQAQGEYVELLEAENARCLEWGKSLQVQVELYKKKTTFTWLEKGGIAVAIGGVLYLGSKLP